MLKTIAPVSVRNPALRIVRKPMTVILINSQTISAYHAHMHKNMSTPRKSIVALSMVESKYFLFSSESIVASATIALIPITSRAINSI